MARILTFAALVACSLVLPAVNAQESTASEAFREKLGTFLYPQDG